MFSDIPKKNGHTDVQIFHTHGLTAFNEMYCSGFYTKCHAIDTWAPLLRGWLVVHHGAECDIGYVVCSGQRQCDQLSLSARQP